MANFDWNDADSADLIQKVFTGDINIANLPIELYEKTANYLTQGVYDVYGIGYDQSIMAPEFETIRHLKANIHVFSAAKTFQSILDIQSQLFDDDGNIRSFRDFEQRASKIESLYNKAWLRAEYRTTINQARSAKNWDRYSSQKNTFPYLRYETKDDSKVRPEHASMDGITLPVDHPFWNQYFPPNGWNCRCTITQIRKATPTKLDQIGTTDDGTPEYKDVTLPDQLFRLNSGKHQVIFVDDKQKGLSHPYFKVDTRYKAYQDRNFDMPIPNDVKDLVKTSGEINQPNIKKKIKNESLKQNIETIKKDGVLNLKQPVAKQKANEISNLGFPAEHIDDFTIKAKQNVKIASNVDDAINNEIEWLKTLSDKQKQSLIGYTTNNYIEINGFLRGRKGFEFWKDDPKMIDFIDTLSETLRNAPKYNGKTYRGLWFDEKKSFDDFINQLKGKTFKDNGFMSSTTMKNAIERFTEGEYFVEMEINSKNGVLLVESSINPDDMEVLFNKGSIFNVDDIQIKNVNKAIIKITEI